MDGWIKLHRSFLDWEWYDQPHMVWLFLKCLLLANHEDKKWRGIEVPRGSFITSYESLSSKKARVSVQSIRTLLKALISTGELTIKTTNKYTHVFVNNYNKYQEVNTQTNNQLTTNQQATNTQLTTTKKERKKEDLSKDKWGDPVVNAVIESFQESYGFEPTDKQFARRHAKNLILKIKKRREQKGKPVNNEALILAVKEFFRLICSREWSKGIQKMGTVYQKTEVLFAELDGRTRAKS